MKDLLHANVPCVPFFNRKHVDIMLQKYCTSMFWMDFKHFLRNPFRAISEEQQFQNFGMKTAKMRAKPENKVFLDASLIYIIYVKSAAFL